MNERDPGSTHVTRRRRRVWGRRIGGVVLLLVLAVFILWLVFGIRVWRHDRKITFDPIPEWNAPILALGASQRAWPPLRDGIVSLSEQIPLLEYEDLPSMSIDDRLRRMDVLAEFARQHAEAVGEDDLLEAYGSVHNRGFEGATPEFVRQWFLEQQPHLERIRAASALPGLGLPYTVGPPADPLDQAFFLSPAERDALARSAAPPAPSAFPLQEMGPSLGVNLLRLPELFLADAALAAEAGDGMRMTADLLAALDFARLMRQRHPNVIDQLVSQRTVTRTCELVGVLLERFPSVFSERDLARLDEAFAAIAEEDFRVRLRGERAFQRDLLQRIYSDDGHGDGILLPRYLTDWGASTGSRLPGGGGWFAQYFLHPGLSWFALSRQEASKLHAAHFDAIASASQDPLWAIDWTNLDVANECVQPRGGGGVLHDLKLFPVALFRYPWSNLPVQSELTRADRDGVRVIIALERYRRAAGTWPSSLAALVPEYLDAVPLDRFDGAPLRYEVRAGQPLLWSVGSNRTDERGEIPAYADDADDAARFYVRPEEIAASAKPGDWIIWRGPRTP